MDIAVVMLILIVALVLFASEWVRMDLVSLMVLLALGLTKQVTPTEAFSGFSNPAVITVAAMFVLSAGLNHTGALSPIGNYLLKVSGRSEARLLITIMLFVAVLSAFVNNVGATAMLMPLAIDLAKKSKISPSRVLIPLAFGSLLGGLCTLIGTPPNILINEMLHLYTGEDFGMFDFTPVGLCLLLTGIGFFLLFGKRLLPARKPGNLVEAYQVKEYVSEVRLLATSPWAGMTIAACGLERDFGLKVRAILRGTRKFPFPHRNRKLHADDILFLEGNPTAILKIREKKGLHLVPEAEHPLPPEVKKAEIVVLEAALTPTSEMVGRTLREVSFRDTHGLTVLAIWRKGAPVVKKVDHIQLQFGDVLLLQGSRDKVMHLGQDHGFLLLGGIDPPPFRPRRGPLAVAILIGVVLLASSGILPIMLTATLGALVMVGLRCLTPREAYEAIDWSIIVLIAGTLPLGIAMERSGTAKLLADLLVHGIGPWGPWAVLSGMFLATFLLTSVMSNAATAVLLAPIAMNAAFDLGADPKPFFMAVAVAASASFMTPVSHQSNALVMGPGGYRFADYLKVGTPLNLLTWVLGSLLIPLAFPF